LDAVSRGGDRRVSMFFKREDGRATDTLAKNGLQTGTIGSRDDPGRALGPPAGGKHPRL
jgi:hypothetical protein